MENLNLTWGDWKTWYCTVLLIVSDLAGLNFYLIMIVFFFYFHVLYIVLDTNKLDVEDNF